MRLVSFMHDGVPAAGRLLDEVTVLRFASAAGTLTEILERGPHPDAIETLIEDRVALADVELLPPIPAPGKVLCVGLNFRSHVAEVATDNGSGLTLFARFGDTFVGHGQAVVRPAVSDSLDWEGELAVVIGRRAWHVAAETALDHVAGYSCMAENSVREWQEHGTQATAGKNFWRSGAFGPALVTADEVGDPSALALETRLNGNPVQRASLGDLVHSVAEVIAYVTTFAPLAVGDVIAMGTPSGVGYRRDPPRYLRPGDTLEVEVGGVGVLRHTVVDEGGPR